MADPDHESAAPTDVAVPMVSAQRRGLLRCACCAAAGVLVHAPAWATGEQASAGSSGQAGDWRVVIGFYRDMSREVIVCYERLDLSGAMTEAEAREDFCVEDVHPSLRKSQAVAIRRYLERRGGQREGAR